jgi:hypothetical protein
VSCWHLQLLLSAKCTELTIMNWDALDATAPWAGREEGVLILGVCFCGQKSVGAILNFFLLESMGRRGRGKELGPILL